MLPKYVIASDVAAPAIRNSDEDVTALAGARAASGYPADYHLMPCSVDRELREGDVLNIRDVTLRTYETPGHSAGHLSFLAQFVELPPALFGGDLLLSLGRVLLRKHPRLLNSRLCGKHRQNYHT